jgi:hypothetical protein
VGNTNQWISCAAVKKTNKRISCAEVEKT